MKPTEVLEQIKNSVDTDFYIKSFNIHNIVNLKDFIESSNNCKNFFKSIDLLICNIKEETSKKISLAICNNLSSFFIGEKNLILSSEIDISLKYKKSDLLDTSKVLELDYINIEVKLEDYITGKEKDLFYNILNSYNELLNNYTFHKIKLVVV